MSTSLSLFESNRLPLAPGELWRAEMSDATTWLRGIGSESVDLIFTDPAYRSLDKHRNVGTTSRLASEWFETVPNEYFEEFFRQCYRVLKRDTHLYVMCDSETMFAIKPMGEAAGFKFWKPIVWDKLRKGMGYHYRARCEFILFFEKGKRKLRSLTIEDVLEFEEEAPDIVKCPRVSGGQFVDNWRENRELLAGGSYPTEKPAGLVQNFITQSSERGDVVLDPFLGSGSTGEAALSLGRRFAGADISQKALDVTEARLAKFSTLTLHQ